MNAERRQAGLTYIEMLVALTMLGTGLLIVTAAVFQRGRIEQGVGELQSATLILEREMETIVARGAPPAGTDRQISLSEKETGLRGAGLRVRSTPYPGGAMLRVHLEVRWENPLGEDRHVSAERLVYTGGAR